ncbi:MAG: hypothetical protein IJO03_02835 [Clostridia bacterium]|nr:hypothetical protein [Clostridia bacterium]MBQ7121179.1 hypothetical protein [Clostridia bacterium]
MKSVISILLVLAAVTLCLFGCSNVPKEPATTTVENHSYVNPYGETVAAPQNAEKHDKVQYLETVNDIEFVMSSYYVYNNCVAKIKDFSLEYVMLNVDPIAGLASVEIMGKSLGEDYMKIGYTAYDKNGTVIRETHLQASLDGAGKGDIVEKCVFELPEETVKVVFHDYVEK